MGWAAWFMLVVLQSLFIALFATTWAAGAGRLHPLARAGATSALWVTFEWARSIVPVVGFTWGELAQSQHNAAWMLRPAAFGGRHLVAAIVVVVNALIVEAIWARRKRPYRWIAAALLLVALPVLLPARKTDGPTMKVAVVQGNVPEDFAGTFHEKDLAILDSHARLTSSLAGQGVDLVVWPESSVGIDLERDSEVAATVESSARAADATMIVGGNLDLDDSRYQVMAFLVDPTGVVADRYQKTHLVPFGEYVPARAFLDFIPMLDQVPRDAVPGRAATLFDVQGHKVAPVISFEGDFGGLVRSRIAAGGRLLIVATNTSTWRRSWASAQHVAMSQVRAAENGVWTIHAALSGISAVIGPDGRTEASSELWVADTLVHEVGIATKVTPYARWGDLVVWLSVVTAVLAVVYGLRRGRYMVPPDRSRSGSETQEERTSDGA